MCVVYSTFRVVQFQLEGFKKLLALSTEFHNGLCLVDKEQLLCQGQTSCVTLRKMKEKVKREER